MTIAINLLMLILWIFILSGPGDVSFFCDWSSVNHIHLYQLFPSIPTSLPLLINRFRTGWFRFHNIPSLSHTHTQLYLHDHLCTHQKKNWYPFESELPPAHRHQCHRHNHKYFHTIKETLCPQNIARSSSASPQSSCSVFRSSAYLCAL